MKKIIFLFILTLAVTFIPIKKTVYAVELHLTNDILQTKSFQNESEKYYIEKYGENYKEKFKKNKDAAVNANKIKSFFDKTDDGNFIYPNYIGGIYIDSNDNLVIQVVDDVSLGKTNLNEINRYKNILEIDENAKIESVKYSYSELENVMKQINTLFVNGKISDLVLELYIDVNNNTVVVGLKEYNEENIDIFNKTILESPMITFKQGNYIITTSDIKAGGPMYGCSVGFRARKLTSFNSKGFVTAAHCVDLNVSYPEFGTVTNRQFGNKIDAAWIKVSSTTGTPVNSFYKYSGYTIPSNELSKSTLIGEPVNGQIVGRIGQGSGTQTGTVITPNSSLIYNDVANSQSIMFTEQVVVDGYQYEGDSGGIVYDPSNLDTLGIATFRNSSYQIIYSRVDNIMGAFGLIRY